MAQTPILLLGATGYLGGSVLSRLLSHPSKDTFDITVLVRSEEKAKKLECFGVKTVVGSLEDTALVEQLAENAQVLFSLADCHDLVGATAFLAGLKKRFENTGKVPVLIHTSGTGIFSFGDAWAKGLYVSEKIYYDNDAEDINNTVPESAPHRRVDLALIQADKEGYVRTHIIFPSTVWGIAKHPLVEAGISNPHSVKIPWLIRASLGRAQAGVVGKGQSTWPIVNVDEQVDLYIILYDAIVSDPDKVDHGSNGYYFGENGHYLLYDVAKAIGKAFVKRGISKSDEPTTFTTEELVKYFTSEDKGNYGGSNSRARAPHSRSLGWQPKLGVEDFFNSIDEEVEAIIKQQQEAKS